MVAALVGTMIGLGLWQLQRLDEKRTYKALVEQRQMAPVEPVAEVLPIDANTDDPALEEVLYRRVTVTGEYADADTVVVPNRTYNSAPGAWVLTPLVDEGGLAVVVNRGFIGFDRSGDIVPPPAPSGTVSVEGLVFPHQERGSFGPTDPSEGRLDTLARVDLDRYEAQLDYPIYPAYVQLVVSDPPEPPTPAEAPALVALGPPTPDEGPHLAYAAQWGIFTAIAAAGYVLLLRRVARDQGRERAAVA